MELTASHELTHNASIASDSDVLYPLSPGGAVGCRLPNPDKRVGRAEV